jgi:hypothetical protein
MVDDVAIWQILYETFFIAFGFCEVLIVRNYDEVS